MSYKSESINFRPQWARITILILEYGYLLKFLRVLGYSSFFTNRNTLGAWKRLLEAARGVGKLSFLLLGSPFSSMEFLSLLGWRG